ncbi:unnamed protein product [Symbiodinium natans]|uniref:Pentatricopeptide repeat-containing protein, chloroplastic n=1 Tax=Symbiodinium natans TaxID=878477 RepID=A0A812SY72_9DINO|nr:unnamed protein product [Symbiodinium natans]
MKSSACALDTRCNHAEPALLHTCSLQYNNNDNNGSSSGSGSGSGSYRLEQSSPGVLNAQNRHGQTALHLAAMAGSSRCLRLLVLEGAAAEIKDVYGRTPAFYAEQRGEKEAVRFIDQGTVFVEAAANADQTGGDKMFKSSGKWTPEDELAVDLQDAAAGFGTDALAAVIVGGACGCICLAFCMLLVRRRCRRKVPVVPAKLEEKPKRSASSLDPRRPRPVWVKQEEPAKQPQPSARISPRPMSDSDASDVGGNRSRRDPTVVVHANPRTPKQSTGGSLTIPTAFSELRLTPDTQMLRLIPVIEPRTSRQPSLARMYASSLLAATGRLDNPVTESGRAPAKRPRTDDLWRESIKRLCDLSSCQVLPDTVRFNATAAAAGKAGQWQTALWLFSSMVRVRAPPDTISFGGALNACREGGRWRPVVQLLSEMGSTGLAPNLVAVGTATSACGRAAQWNGALQLFAEPPDLSTDLVLFNSTITACEKGTRWASALQLLAAMPTSRAVPNQVSCGAGISACARKWERALRLFHQLAAAEAPNTVTLSSCVGACQKATAWQSAHFLLASSVAEGIRPNEVTVNTAISACEEVARWQMGLHLLQDVLSASPAGLRVGFNAAISTCAKAAQWQRGLRLLAEMPQARVQANVISFNAALDACHKGRQWQAAIFLLSAMDTAQVAADAVSFSTALSTCERAGRWEVGLQLLSRLEESAIQVDAVCCAAAVSACEKGSQWQLALELLWALPSRHALPDVVCFNAGLSSCEKAAQWLVGLRLLHDAPAFEADEEGILKITPACTSTQDAL